MKHRIVRTIRRPDAASVKLLGQMGVATVHEAQGRTGLLAPYMRPIYTSARVAGPAVTVLCQPGDVLVVTCTAESTDGMFGDLLATSLRSRGVAGLVINAGVRDVADLTAMDFPVWSKAISAMGTVKATLGSVNVPVTCAGELIRPGDAVIGDLDGVVVVSREDVEEVVKAAQQRIAKEEKNRERLRAGEAGLDMYGLRAKLKDLGVVYVDQED